MKSVSHGPWTLYSLFDFCRWILCLPFGFLLAARFRWLQGSQKIISCVPFLSEAAWANCKGFLTHKQKRNIHTRTRTRTVNQLAPTPQSLKSKSLSLHHKTPRPKPLTSFSSDYLALGGFLLPWLIFCGCLCDLYLQLSVSYK